MREEYFGDRHPRLQRMLESPCGQNFVGFIALCDLLIEFGHYELAEAINYSKYGGRVVRAPIAHLLGIEHMTQQLD